MTIGFLPLGPVVKNLDPLTMSVFPLIERFIPASVDQLLLRHQALPRQHDLLTPSRILRFELLQATRPETSFQEVLREVWQSWRLSGLVHGNMPTSSALAQARSRLPAWVLATVLKYTSSLADCLSIHPSWPHHRLLSIDGTFLRLPHHSPLIENFGRTRNQNGESYFPQTLAVWVLLVQHQIVLEERLGLSTDSDETIAPRLLPKILSPGDLILGDAHFGHYPTLAVIGSCQAFYLMRAPSNLPRQFDLSTTTNDFQLELKLSLAMKDKYCDLSMPEKLPVRVLRYIIPSRDELNGTEQALFLTNLPGEQFSHEQLSVLPPLRWIHETTNNDIKTRLGLGNIRSLLPERVRREQLAHLCLSNIVRLMMVQQNQQPLKNKSFTAAITALRNANQQLRTLPQKYSEITAIMQEMIQQQFVIPRPKRSEPRLRRPQGRPYRVFTTPRSQWRNARKVG